MAAPDQPWDLISAGFLLGPVANGIPSDVVEHVDGGLGEMAVSVYRESHAGYEGEAVDAGHSGVDGNGHKGHDVGARASPPTK